MMSLRKIVRTSLVLSFGTLIGVSSGRSDDPEPEVEIPPVVKAVIPRITVSPETTVLLKPLRSDGGVDYVADLNQRMSSGVTPDNNAAVPLLRVTGSKILGKHAEQYCQMLGIPLVPPEGVTSPQEFEVPPKQFELRETRMNEYDFVFSHPWKASEYPVMARWLDQHATQLELVEQAAEKSHFYTPLISDDVNCPSVLTTLLPQAQSMRDICRWVSMRCMFRLEQGRLQEAIADVRRIHRLAQLQGQGQTLIEGLVSFAIETHARRAAIQILQSSALTPELASELQQEVESWTPLVTVADKMDVAERWMFLDSVCGLARDPQILVLDDVESQAQLRKLALVDGVIDEALKLGNRRYSEIVAALRFETPAQRWNAIQKIEGQIQLLRKKHSAPRSLLTFYLGSSTTKGQLLGELMLVFSLPAFSQFEVASERSLSNKGLLKVGIAVRRFHLQEGKLPKSLDSLSPKYLTSLPVDRMTGEPLRYFQDGSVFRISCSGQDGVFEDDLSQPIPAEPPVKTSDDLVLEIQLPEEDVHRR